MRERMAEAEQGPHVPHVFEVEVLSALRRHTLAGNVSARRADQLLEDLTSMRVTRYPHTALLPRMWELRENVTVHDAAYVALAETLDMPLITTDARLGRASGIRATVEVYK